MEIAVNTHEKNMIRFAKEHSEAIVLSADLGTSCEVKAFRATYPERYFTMGIAEQNMCSWAAGLCREGYRPFIHTFAVFLYRRILDQVEMSVAYPNLPVVFPGFVPGITTPGGVSHQAINDVAVMRSVPNMAVIDIGDATEIEGVLDLAYQYSGPVYIRMLRKEVPRLFPSNEPIQLNRARVLSKGTDLLVLSSSICTEEAMRAVSVLRNRGVSVQHMHVSTLKPFTDESLLEAAQSVKYGVVTIENHLKIGGLGSAMADYMVENGVHKDLIKIGLDGYAHGASKLYLMEKYGLDAMNIVHAAEKLMKQSLAISKEDLDTARFVDFLEV